MARILISRFYRLGLGRDLTPVKSSKELEAILVVYRHRKLVREGGVAALKRQVNTEHCHQNRTDQSIANTVIEFSLDNPHLGQVQVANQLWKHYEIELSASGVRNVWLRENMQTIGLRLQRKAAYPYSGSKAKPHVR